MTDYAAPLADMRFALNEIAGIGEIARLPGCEQATSDVVDAVLEEAGKLAGGVLAPLNRIGDQQASRLENGVVRTPDGFKAAYAKYVEGGWNALPFPPEHGGQGLPMALSTAVFEMWNSANMGFALCPLLNVGAVEALAAHGAAEQQRLYLPRLISGEWTGTMNLTEPQAGSDVGALRTRAVTSLVWSVRFMITIAATTSSSLSRPARPSRGTLPTETVATSLTKTGTPRDWNSRTFSISPTL